MPSLSEAIASLWRCVLSLSCRLRKWTAAARERQSVAGVPDTHEHPWPPKTKTSLRQTLVGFIGITRSEEHTSELQSLMRNSYAVFCLQKKITNTQQNIHINR